MAIAPAASHAETFILKEGTVIEGTVLRNLGNTLTIKLDNAGMHQLPIEEIDRIEITINDGTKVAGSLAWWADEKYVLVTGEGLVEIKDGVISKVSDSETELPTVATEPTQAEIDQEAVTPAPAARPVAEELPSRKLEPTM
ncbi:MAG: hypothetical protein ACR2QJ_01935 [Geminicoccaceae bacterium]